MSSGPEYYTPLPGNESTPGMQPSTGTTLQHQQLQHQQLQQLQQPQIHHAELMAEEQTPINPGIGDDEDDREGDDDDDGDEGLGDGEEGDISMTEGAFSEAPQYQMLSP